MSNRHLSLMPGMGRATDSVSTAVSYDIDLLEEEMNDAMRYLFGDSSTSSEMNAQDDTNALAISSCEDGCKIDGDGCKTDAGSPTTDAQKVLPEIKRCHRAPAACHGIVDSQMARLYDPVGRDMLRNLVMYTDGLESTDRVVQVREYIRRQKVCTIIDLLVIQYILNEGILMKLFDETVDISQAEPSVDFE